MMKMNKETANTILVEQYYRLLENLNEHAKQKLISKLLESMKTKPKSRSTQSLQSLFGSFSSRQSADTIIQNIKKARRFSRTIEKL